MSQRNYVNLSHFQGQAVQLHYRQQGQGKEIILLHPSPLSSSFMQPLLDVFSKQGKAIAWDTPGYGQSDPLSATTPGLGGYVEALSQFISALGLKTPIIYGSATGAQIAIEFAKAHPDQTCGLILENAAWFHDSERDAMLDNYFPDISPKEDGSHLQLVWKMVSQLYHYFPWYDTSAEALVNESDIPLAVKQKTVLDYLIAGEEYHRAYRAAFLNEKPEKLAAVKIPTILIRWDSSLLKKYVDRLDDAGLPDNIAMLHCSTGIEARFEALTKAFSKHLGRSA